MSATLSTQAFGDYALETLESEAASRRVWRARHQMLDMPVTLSLFDVGSFQSADDFILRAQAATSLSHPHLVPTVDAGIHDETPFVASQAYDAADLGQLLKDMGPLPAPLACEYVRQAALGLQSAHEQGFFHGWLHPASLLLTPIVRKTRTNGSVSLRPAPNAAVKVAGVGLQPHRASINDRPYEIDADDGPVEALPPERIGGSTVDARTDVYGLGICLFGLLTAQSPFPASSPIDSLLKIQQKPAPAIDKLLEDLDLEIVELVARMLAKDPADRPASALEVAKALQPHCVESVSGSPLAEPLHDDHADSHVHAHFGAELHTPSDSSPTFVRKEPEKDNTKMWLTIGTVFWLTAGLLWVLSSYTNIFKGSGGDKGGPPPIKRSK